MPIHSAIERFAARGMTSRPARGGGHHLPHAETATGRTPTCARGWSGLRAEPSRAAVKHSTCYGAGRRPSPTHCKLEVPCPRAKRSSLQRVSPRRAGGCRDRRNDERRHRKRPKVPRRPGPDADERRPRREPRPRRREGGRGREAGAQVVCLPELFRSPYFCQREDAGAVRPGRAGPRAQHRGPGGGGASEAEVAVVVPIFERRAPGLYHNTAVVIDADGEMRGPLPQDAHPRRPARSTRSTTSRRATSASGLRHRGRAHRHARLLGPVVSRRARG